MSVYAIYGNIIFPETSRRGPLKLLRFSEIKIESSWQSLTDTATIVLPKRVRDFDRNKISEVFKEGDPVVISLGYNGKLKEEFSGYICKTPVGIPLTISCEDEMYKLKRKTVSISQKNCSLKQLLRTIAPGYPVSVDETHMCGTIRYSRMPVSKILEDLKNSGICVWFEGKTLHAFNTSKSNVDPVKITIEKTANENLTQKAVEDCLVIMSILHKAKKTKVEYGDKGAGKTIHRHLSGIEMSRSEMLNECKKIYAQQKLPGLDGDITLFGIPSMKHGMKIQMNSFLYPEKDGAYYVDAITKTVNRDGGYRQVCKLGDKVI